MNIIYYYYYYYIIIRIEAAPVLSSHYFYNGLEKNTTSDFEIFFSAATIAT